MPIAEDDGRITRQNQVMTNPRTATSWEATIRTEGNRLAAMPVDSLEFAVPSLDGWTVERVVRHVGRVHRWVTALVTAAPDADPDAVARAAPSLSRGSDCLGEYHDALEAMLDAFDAAEPDRPVASFLGAANVAFWLRRQAAEVAIHRTDAADALHAGGGPAPDPIDEEAAADGISEWLDVFAVHRPLDESDVLVGSSIGIVCAHDGGTRSWRLEFGPGVRSTVITGEPSTSSPPVATSALLMGNAPDLFLTLWRRRPLDTVTVSGDEDLARTFYETMRF